MSPNAIEENELRDIPRTPAIAAGEPVMCDIQGRLSSQVKSSQVKSSQVKSSQGGMLIVNC